jgi:hypothetical protein
MKERREGGRERDEKEEGRGVKIMEKMEKRCDNKGKRYSE